MSVLAPARLALPVYWLALAIATHYPRVSIPGDVPSSDKLIHLVAFGGLAFLLWRFLVHARPPSTRTVWLAATILIGYATLDEYTQQFVGRHTELADWLANLLGIVIVLATVEIRRRVRARRATYSAPGS